MWVKDDSKVEDLGGGGDHEAMFSETVCLEQQKEQMMEILDVLQLSLREFRCIYEFISARQVVRVE